MSFLFGEHRLSGEGGGVVGVTVGEGGRTGCPGVPGGMASRACIHLHHAWGGELEFRTVTASRGAYGGKRQVGARRSGGESELVQNDWMHRMIPYPSQSQESGMKFARAMGTYASLPHSPTLCTSGEGFQSMSATKSSEHCFTSAWSIIMTVGRS